MSKIGCHISIAGGIANAPARAGELGCEVFQIFTRSPRGGPAPKIDKATAELFKAEMKKYNQTDCYIHTPYYINFASQDKKIADASIRIIREELERGTLIGAKYIMTHLGSAKDVGKEKALKLVAAGIKKILLGYKGTTQFLLEISAGSGASIGATFEELAVLLETDKRLGVCLDSAHLFGGGYDIKSKEGFKKVIAELDRKIGLEKVKLIHSNDSKVPLGSHKDRHDHIGHGLIGVEGFENLIDAFPQVDFVLETEHDKVKEDIQKLKGIRENLG